MRHSDPERGWDSDEDDDLDRVSSDSGTSQDLKIDLPEDEPYSNELPHDEHRRRQPREHEVHRQAYPYAHPPECHGSPEAAGYQAMNAPNDISDADLREALAAQGYRIEPH